MELTAQRTVDEWVQTQLVCPREHLPLAQINDSLVCAAGHTYPIVEGVPVMLLGEIRQTHGIFAHTMELVRRFRESTPEPVAKPSQCVQRINPIVQEVVSATCGYLYQHLVGKLTSYPIPELRIDKMEDPSFLDIGCNWGRWTIAAARKGFRAVGIDPSLGAILAAREVARDCGVAASFVVADARHLPFRAGAFGTVFSYSVLQHFSREDLEAALSEVCRVLQGQGRSYIQMPNRYGIRCVYHQSRRGFRKTRDFEVRYFSPSDLRQLFEARIGKTNLSVDGFFGLGIQPGDLPLMPLGYRMVIHASECLRYLSERLPGLVYVADSLYLLSQVRNDPARAGQKHQGGSTLGGMRAEFGPFAAETEAAGKIS